MPSLSQSRAGSPVRLWMVPTATTGCDFGTDRVMTARAFSSAWSRHADQATATLATPAIATATKRTHGTAGRRLPGRQASATARTNPAASSVIKAGSAQDGALADTPNRPYNRTSNQDART